MCALVRRLKYNNIDNVIQTVHTFTRISVFFDCFSTSNLYNKYVNYFKKLGA